MKKILKSIVLGACMVFSMRAFAATKKSIVCTTYPEYDWIRNILGEKTSSFNLTLLQNKGTDLHSYQPSFKDIAAVSTCDLFVYVGGESDGWVKDAVSNSRNKDQIVVNMMEALGDKVREEEVVEGMQAEDDHDHHHEADHHHHDEEEEIEYDEHVWLSLKNAIELSGILCEKIQKLDPANSSAYKKNTDEYISRLADLDAEYEKAIGAAGKKVILFGDRYPFRYLSDDYGLKYYAAFVGCSAESEASFETIVFLAKKVDELGLHAVFTIEKSNKKIAETIVSNTRDKNQSILEMDSLQSVTEKDIAGGRNYLSAMKKNLEVLKKALK